MADEATLDDWLEVIGLKATIDALLAGKLKIADARAEADERRDVYPNVSIDWLEIMDVVDKIIAHADALAAREASVVEDVLSIDFEELGLHVLPPDWLPDFTGDRLLTAEETRTINELLAAAENAEPDLDDLDDLRSDLEAAIEARAEAEEAKQQAAEDLQEAIAEAAERNY